MVRLRRQYLWSDPGVTNFGDSRASLHCIWSDSAVTMYGDMRRHYGATQTSLAVVRLRPPACASSTVVYFPFLPHRPHPLCGPCADPGVHIKVRRRHPPGTLRIHPGTDSGIPPVLAVVPAPHSATVQGGVGNNPLATKKVLGELEGVASRGGYERKVLPAGCESVPFPPLCPCLPCGASCPGARQ